MRAHNRGGAKGSHNIHAKLTEAQVKEIKIALRDRVTDRNAIATAYGISIHTLKEIIQGVTWRHVKI